MATVDKPQIQSAGFLLELSPDWLIQRASENAHRFFGQYHQRLVGDPLSEFTLAQPLHDLRNSLARQRSSSGVARAYRVRLIEEPRYFDIAFQALDGTILLEGLPSAAEGIGDWLGSVSRLIEGLHGGDRKALMDGATRRMRALTGFDRVTLTIGAERVESSRGKFADLAISGELPAIITSTDDAPVALFPVKDDPIPSALLRAPTAIQLEELRAAGIKSALRVPVMRDGEGIGQFQCDSRSGWPVSFELHAAAELFAQVFGMLLDE